MPKNDLEVFQYLSADPQTSLHVDYLTYALFTHDKHSWIAHFTNQNGRPPAQPEIDDWIANITDQQFGRYMDLAVEFFDDAARTYLAEELATEQTKSFQEKVIAAVSFKRQFGLALFTSIVTPIILGLVIAGVVNYQRWWPSIVNIF